MSSHSQTPAGNQDELVWTVWPAGQRPHAAAAVVALILGVSWYGYIGFGSLIYTVIALVVLTGSLAFFLFPTTYTLDARGPRLRGCFSRRDKLWSELACYLRADDFIALSTTAEPTERSLAQGGVLRLAGNGEEVAAFVARYLPEWQRPLPGSEADG